LVEPGPPGIEVARAVGPYEGVVREIVVGLKFGRRLPLAGVAAAAMARLRPEEPPSEIVPVPAAPLRRLWRGFDPAEEIALALSAATGAPLSDGLRRTQGPRQMGRRRAARLSRGPVVRLRRSPPERALLVDDVHTTGATLAACAGALRDGGCRSVAALTLARA
jgi:predicted amidophosphoribosyltransferase